MRPLFISIAIFLFATLPYWEVLQYHFTAIDTLPTIAAARIESPGDLLRLPFRELRGGMDPALSYYRPLTLLTYTLDHAGWGLDPRGYHLTDLALHGVATVGVFWLARTAFRRGDLEAALAAALFALHPVTIEVVPANTRRGEPILLTGLSLLLIGGSTLPRRRAWAMTVAGTLVSVMAVERGLVAPAVLFSYLLFVRNEVTWKARLRRASAWTAPAAAIATGSYLFRRLLTPDSGIDFSWPELVNIPLSLSVQLVYPQQVIELSVSGRAMKLVVGLFGLIVIASFIAGFRKSPRWPLYLACAGWIVSYALLLAIAGKDRSWYPYTAVGPLVVAAASLLMEAVRRDPDSSAGPRWMGLPASLAVGAMVLLWVQSSPVFREYSGWRTAERLSRTVLEGAVEVSRSLPEEEFLVLINVPAFFRESDRDYLITRTAAILWPRSLEAWFELHSLERPLLVLGSSSHVGQFRSPAVEFLEGGKLRVGFQESGSDYVTTQETRASGRPFQDLKKHGFEFDWPPEELKNRRYRVYVFDGEKLIQLPFAS